MSNGMFTDIYDLQTQIETAKGDDFNAWKGASMEAMPVATSTELGRGIRQATGMQSPEDRAIMSQEAKMQAVKQIYGAAQNLDMSKQESYQTLARMFHSKGMMAEAMKVTEAGRKYFEARTARIKANKPTSKGAGTAAYKNAVSRAKALVSQHGGDLTGALDYVLMNPTGSTSFDLGVGYQRFLEKKGEPGVGVSIGVGTASPVEEESSDTHLPTFENIEAERGVLSRQLVDAAPQDRKLIEAQFRALNQKENSLRASVREVADFAKTNIKPIGNELKNISDVRTFW